MTKIKVGWAIIWYKFVYRRRKRRKFLKIQKN